MLSVVDDLSHQQTELAQEMRRTQRDASKVCLSHVALSGGCSSCLVLRTTGHRC
jgi:hypothetical protein